MNVDLTGLSFDAALAMARASFEAAMDEAVERTELLLRDHGATDLEVENYVRNFRAACITDVDEKMRELVRFIDEPRAPAALQ